MKFIDSPKIEHWPDHLEGAFVHAKYNHYGYTIRYTNCHPDLEANTVSIGAPYILAAHYFDQVYRDEVNFTFGPAVAACIEHDKLLNPIIKWDVMLERNNDYLATLNFIIAELTIPGEGETPDSAEELIRMRNLNKFTEKSLTLSRMERESRGYTDDE